MSAPQLSQELTNLLNYALQEAENRAALEFADVAKMMFGNQK